MVLTDTFKTMLASEIYTDGEKVLLAKWLLDRSVRLPSKLNGIAELMGADQDRIEGVAEERKRKNRERMRRARALHNAHNAHNANGVVCNAPPAPFSPPTTPSYPNTPHTHSSGAGAGAYARGDIPSQQTVASVAESAMGVPRWYAEWWYAEMSARDWRNTNGTLVGNQNWRPTLKAWYNRAKPEELDRMREEHERRTREQQPPADAGKPEYWILCRERCANCKGAGCAKGVKTPPDRQDPARPPEECPRFKPLPPESPQKPPEAARSARSAGDGETPSPPPKRAQRAPAGAISGCPSPKTTPRGSKGEP